MSTTPIPKPAILFTHDQCVDAGDTLIAATSILGAIHHQYATEGVLELGAMLHVVNLMDKVIRDLGLDDLDGTQEKLPF